MTQHGWLQFMCALTRRRQVSSEKKSSRTLIINAHHSPMMPAPSLTWFSAPHQTWNDERRLLCLNTFALHKLPSMVQWLEIDLLDSVESAPQIISLAVTPDGRRTNGRQKLENIFFYSFPVQHTALVGSHSFDSSGVRGWMTRQEKKVEWKETRVCLCIHWASSIHSYPEGMLVVFSIYPRS